MDQATFDRLVTDLRESFFRRQGREDWEISPKSIAAFFFRDRPSPYLKGPWMSIYLPSSDPDTILQELIDGSKKDRTCWDALVEIARGRLRVEMADGGKEHPAVTFSAMARGRSEQRNTLLEGPLLDWIVDVLGDQLLAPKERRRPRPPKSRKTTGRDRLMCLLIERSVANYGLCPTRSGGWTRCCAEGGSACDVVGAAAGMKKYKTAERVWLIRDRLAS